jgi:hypothetical protein
MSPFIQKAILLYVLTLLLVHNILGEDVNVVNYLENNLDLTLHCKSKDDDLGVHLLHHGENFRWSFTPSILGNTLFYCSFIWNGELHWFEIYKGNNLAKTDCDSCDWRIFKSGPCRIQEVFGSICFPWNK